MTLVTTAQTGSPKAQSLSLADCIQNALKKNLDLQIARYNPPQARLDLQAAYAGYDPSFSIGGQHNYSLSGGSFEPTFGTSTLPSSTDENSFSSSLGGLLPWGLGYTLSGNVAESYGRLGGTSVRYSLRFDKRLGVRYSDAAVAEEFLG